MAFISPSHHAAHRREVNSEMIRDLLIRVCAGRMSPHNGGIAIHFGLIDGLERGWRRAALRLRDLYILLIVLFRPRLHGFDKLVTAQKHLRF